MVVEKVNFTVNYDFVLSNKREKQRFIKYTFSEFCFSFGFFPISTYNDSMVILP